MCCSKEVLPIGLPLDSPRDEEIAQLLALHGTASRVERFSRGKHKACYISQLVNGTGSAKKKSEQFKGRVKFLLEETREEIYSYRLALARKACETYDDFMEPAFRHKRPEVAASVARDTLHSTGVFGLEDGGKRNKDDDDGEYTQEQLALVLREALRQ